MFTFYKKALFPLLVLLTLFTSCHKEAEENTPAENITQLPNVKEFRSADSKIINDLRQTLNINKNNNSVSTNSVQEQSYNVSNAIIAKYEGYDNIEYVYVPDLNDTRRFTVFMYVDGILVPDFKLTLTNNENSLIVETSKTSSITYAIQDNYVTDITIHNETQEVSNTVVNGTNSVRKDYFQNYIDCNDAILDQAADIICNGCGFGKWAFGIGCSAWVVCRGATIVGCTAMAVAI